MFDNNGRVDVVNNNNFNMYDMFKEETKSKYVSEEAIKSIHSKNELSEIFFSRQNIDILQQFSLPKQFI